MAGLLLKREDLAHELDILHYAKSFIGKITFDIKPCAVLDVSCQIGNLIKEEIC